MFTDFKRSIIYLCSIICKAYLNAKIHLNTSKIIMVKWNIEMKCKMTPEYMFKYN